MASNTINGTILGSAPTVTDVIAAKGVDDPNRPNQVSIIFSSKPGLCPSLQEARSGPPAILANVSLMILVFKPMDPSGVLAAGTYSPSSSTLGGTYETYDAACNSVAPHADVSSGTGTITEVGSSVRGSFDLMLGSDHVTGSFAAPLCAVPPLADAGSGDGGVRCLP
jgi:hypothetical protein